LKADTEKAIEIFKQCEQVNIPKESTPELQKKVKDLSLEQVQLSKDHSFSDSIHAVIGSFYDVNRLLSVDALEVINRIRQENKMRAVKMPNENAGLVDEKRLILS
jgi:hypothetical protein